MQTHTPRPLLYENAPQTTTFIGGITVKLLSVWVVPVVVLPFAVWVVPLPVWVVPLPVWVVPVLPLPVWVVPVLVLLFAGVTDDTWSSGQSFLSGYAIITGTDFGALITWHFPLIQIYPTSQTH